jgi:hypothetical protein
MVRRRDIERAKLELAADHSANLLDPRWVTIGLQIGKTLGWRRIATLAAAGVLTAGLAGEWTGVNLSKSS